MIDRGGAGEATGRALLRLSKRMFRQWHRVRDGTIDRQRFRAIAARLRREVKAALEGGQRCGCTATAATCFEILKVEEGLWTFVRVGGCRADEQRLGAGAAACGDLASDQRGYGQRRGEPVRGADADGGGDLSPAEAERAGVSQLVLRVALAGREGPVAGAGELTAEASCWISPTPPREPLRRSRAGRIGRSWRRGSNERPGRCMPPIRPTSPGSCRDTPGIPDSPARRRSAALGARRDCPRTSVPAGGRIGLT